MYLSIDFGGSTIDSVTWELQSEKSSVLNIRSFEKDKSFSGIDSFLKLLDLHSKPIDKIFVTGGKSRFFPDDFENIPVYKVPEIEAIGKGGFYLLRQQHSLKDFHNAERLLIVSMGTGTCMVELQQQDGVYLQSVHVGGTGVGGGTFLGLCRSLLGETDLDALKKLFLSGNNKKVDLLVNDIIGSGIGKVPAEAIASNLGQMSREIEFSKADLASGIVHLIGQTIGMVSIFAAKSQKSSAILLTGKLTRIEKILDVIQQAAKIYQIPVFIPKQAAYVSAFGAGVMVDSTSSP